jgi:predicted alpha/beta hydrolase family esterase
MTRFLYLHGNGTLRWAHSFAPKLKNDLEDLGQETFFETMPDSIVARSKYWMRFLDDEMVVQSDDILIGWSSGAVCAMRYAQTHKLKGLVLIGPHYTDLGEEFEKASGYFDDEWQWGSIKNNVDKILLFHGNDDPYIPTKDFYHIADHIDATRFEIQGGGHFESTKEVPGLIEAIKANFL